MSLLDNKLSVSHIEAGVSLAHELLSLPPAMNMKNYIKDLQLRYIYLYYTEQESPGDAPKYMSKLSLVKALESIGIIANNKMIIKYYPIFIKRKNFENVLPYDKFYSGTERLLENETSIQLLEEMVFLGKNMSIIKPMSLQGNILSILDLAEKKDHLITMKDLKHILVDCNTATNITVPAYTRPLTLSEYNEVMFCLQSPSNTSFANLVKNKRKAIHASIDNIRPIGLYSSPKSVYKTNSIETLSITQNNSNSSNVGSGKTIAAGNAIVATTTTTSNATNSNIMVRKSLTASIEPLVGLETLHSKLTSL